MMDDTISRQDAIDAILDLSDFVSVIELFEYVEDHDLQDSRSGGIIDAIDAVLLLPSAQPEPLTDKEQRIFLAAMGREEKVCKEVDRGYANEPHEVDSLVRVCREIKRKVIGALWT